MDFNLVLYCPPCNSQWTHLFHPVASCETNQRTRLAKKITKLIWWPILSDCQNMEWATKPANRISSSSYIYVSQEPTSFDTCYNECDKTSNCQSFTYHPTIGCKIYNDDHTTSEIISAFPETTYYERCNGKWIVPMQLKCYPDDSSCVQAF